MGDDTPKVDGEGTEEETPTAEPSDEAVASTNTPPEAVCTACEG